MDAPDPTGPNRAGPDNTDNTRARLDDSLRLDDSAGLDDSDHASLAQAAAILLDARSIVIRTSEWLGGKLNGVGRRFADIGPHLLGQDWQPRYQALVEAALRNAYRVGTVGLDSESDRQPWHWFARLVAAATGSASGFVGVPGIAADLPITTCLMVRSIAEIARSHGEDLTSPDTRQACIEVFAFGGPEIEDEDIDIAYWTIRGSLSHASITLLIRQVAARFGVMLSQKYLMQAVPLIGAAAGGTLNYVFMHYYQQMARVHFTLRELERRHDPAAVRACFDSLLRQMRAGQDKPRRLPPDRLLQANTVMPDHPLRTSGGNTWTGRTSKVRSKPAT
ncbi:MAG TPA: EcsC family protein [Acetobacteraceae bacterium]|nr:EcsC family protein [Acetobacteraceae bacterium]